MAAPTPKSDVPEAAHAGDAQRHTITVDDSDVAITYANFCRVSILAEELVLDLGLNMHAFAAPPSAIKANQRVVLSCRTAKQLVGLLHAAVQRYEQIFGPVEMDLQKKVQTAQAQAPSVPAKPSA